MTHVYFFQVESGSIKIGFTADLATRIKALRCLAGGVGLFLAHHDGTRDTERAWHRQHAEAYLGSEWFRPTPELLGDIDTVRGGGIPEWLLCKPTSVADIPEPLTASRIKAIRASLGMTQTQLAAALGVTENAVRRWEYGDRHPRWATMEKLNALAKSNGSPNGHKNAKRKVSA